MSIRVEYQNLLEILREAGEFLARPDNDFSWSSWGDATAALRDIDSLITQIESGSLPKRLDVSVLFAPTGPMQEVSVSSGWGQDFLSLAERFDAAGELAYKRGLLERFRRFWQAS